MRPAIHIDGEPFDYTAEKGASGSIIRMYDPHHLPRWVITCIVVPLMTVKGSVLHMHFESPYSGHNSHVNGCICLAKTIKFGRAKL